MHKTYSKVLLSRGPVNALNKSLDNISTFIVSIYTSFWIERTSRSVQNKEPPSYITTFFLLSSDTKNFKNSQHMYLVIIIEAIIYSTHCQILSKHLAFYLYLLLLVFTHWRGRGAEAVMRTHADWVEEGHGCHLSYCSCSHSQMAIDSIYQHSFIYDTMKYSTHFLHIYKPPMKVKLNHPHPYLLEPNTSILHIILK